MYETLSRGFVHSVLDLLTIDRIIRNKFSFDVMFKYIYDCELLVIDKLHNRSCFVLNINLDSEYHIENVLNVNNVVSNQVHSFKILNKFPEDNFRFNFDIIIFCN